MSRYVSIVLAVLLLFAFSGCDEAPVIGGGDTTPPASADGVGATDALGTAANPGDTATAPPADATQPGGTGTAPPADATQPETAATGTAAEAPTGTPAATATPQPGSESPGDADSLKVDPVTGKANVSETLTLRKTASSSAESVAKIPKDGEFTVIQVETGKKWLKVEYDGKEGYVQARYVSVGSKDTDRVCTVFCNSVLNVRNGAGTGHDVIGSVKPGTNLVVTSKTSVSGQTWYKVALGSSSGYVIAKYCRISET